VRNGECVVIVGACAAAAAFRTQASFFPRPPEEADSQGNFFMLIPTYGGGVGYINPPSFPSRSRNSCDFCRRPMASLQGLRCPHQDCDWDVCSGCAASVSADPATQRAPVQSDFAHGMLRDFQVQPLCCCVHAAVVPEYCVLC
jgi:hypothetical protein